MTTFEVDVGIDQTRFDDFSEVISLQERIEEQVKGTTVSSGSTGNTRDFQIEVTTEKTEEELDKLLESMLRETDYWSVNEI